MRFVNGLPDPEIDILVERVKKDKIRKRKMDGGVAGLLDDELDAMEL